MTAAPTAPSIAVPLVPPWAPHPRTAGRGDTLGNQETVTGTSGRQGTSRLEDDRIEDKHPLFDAARTVRERFPGSFSACNVLLNKSAAVTKLVVPLELVTATD